MAMSKEASKSEPGVLSLQDMPEELSKFGLLEVGDGSVPLEPLVVSIQDLPDGILGKIMNYLPQTETQIQALRLVCKLWDRTVKEQYHYGVKIQEDGRGPQPILHQMKHRISRVEIQKMDISVLKPDGTCIFGYPNLIRHLTCCKYQSTGLSPLNLQALLGLLSKNLRSLDLTLTPEIYNHDFYSDLAFNFEALTKLEVTCYHDSDCLDQAPSLLRVLAASTFPKLRAIKGSFDFGKDYCLAKKIFGHVLRLLAANGNVESLFLESPFGQIPSEPSSLAGLKSIQTLKKFEGDGGWATVPSEVDPEVINFCKYLLPNNYGGLVSITLHFDDSKTPLDLAVFESCSKLKELVLAGPLWNSSSLENLHRLPESITYLSIADFKVLSRELVATLSPLENGKGLRLQRLLLKDTGHEDLLGLSPEVLEKILTSGSLLEATLEEILSSDSRVLFAAVFRKFNYRLRGVYHPYDYSRLNIQLRRGSSANRWELIYADHGDEGGSEFDYDSD